MIVKNEGAVLARCLSSVGGAADELIVVDTGSTDNTVGIARGFGARVVQTEWHDSFAEARNVSIEGASGRWILWLDADDVVPAESVPAFNELKEQEPLEVYGFTVRNEKPGGVGSEFIQARMFPNHPRLRFERRIHEQIMPSAARLGLSLVPKPVVIEHHGYADSTAMTGKAERNIRLLLEEFDENDPDCVLAVEIADSYTLLEQWDDAEEWYHRVLQVPQSATRFPVIAGQAAMGIGKIRSERKDYGEAVTYLRKALELVPDRPDAMFSLAVALELGGSPEQAAEQLEAIGRVEAKPTLVGIDFRQARIKAFLRLERVLRELGRGDQALQAADRARRAMGDRPEVLNAIGTVEFRAGRLVDALHTFESSLKVRQQGNVDAYIGLCQVYRKAGRDDAVSQTLKTMHALFGTHPSFWAFYVVCRGEPAEREIPASMDKEEVARLRAQIENRYGGVSR